MGLRIKKLRRAHGLTQTELANKLGSPFAGFICDMETGRKTMNGYQLFELEQILGPIWQQGCKI